MRRLVVHGPLLAVTWAWVGFVAPACGEGSFFESSVGAVEEGNEALLAGEAARALTAYQAAAEAVPESPGLDYDEGLAMSLGGNHEDATQELLRALETRDPVLKQRIYAALGAAYARWGLALEREAPPVEAAPGQEPSGEAPSEDEAALGKWRKAVEHLEEALVREPKDTASRDNLEVALLRVDPPCAVRDKELEPNDQPETAALVELQAEEPALQSNGAGGPGGPVPPGGPQPTAPEGAQDRLTWKRQVLSCPDDVDWFQIPLTAGDRLSVQLTTPPEAGRLSLTLWDAQGQTRLRPAGDEILTALDLTAERDGPVLVRVDNLDDDEVSYQLSVTSRPACSSTEDRFEENDSQHRASQLTPGPLDGLKLCPLDDDWYAFTLAQGESLFVYSELAPPPESDDAAADKEPAPTPDGPPAFELTVHDASGAVVATGAPADRGRVATLFTPGEGGYWIKVSGAAALESRYSLLLKVIEPCPKGDDELEDNDTPEDASDLLAVAQQSEQGAAGAPGAPGAVPPGQPQAGGGQPKPLFLRICPGDIDWFHVQTSAEKPFNVTAVFDHAKGDLAMALNDATGSKELAASDSSSPEVNGEGLMIPKTDEPEKRLIVVKSAASTPRGENFYLLKIEQPQGGGEQNQQGDDKDKDKDNDDKDEQEPKDEQDQEQPKPQDDKEQRPQPLEDALDKLDRNSENLEARQRKHSSPHANHAPEKDW